MHANNFPASIQGTVYGVVLNDRGSIQRMGAALQEAPYKAPPRAPVMYIKPANTLAANGSVVTLPLGATQVEIGATVGLVMGVQASHLTTQNALTAVQGCVVVADLSLPHTSYYRPAVREKCFDGSCVFAETAANAASTQNLAALHVQTLVNGEEVGQWSLNDLIRTAPELLRDVTEFMTLSRGDVLLLGVQWQAPTASPGDVVKVSVHDVGQLEFSIVSEARGAA
jgi:5-oxopent-3-ene-1,2,5-tricarboxylate decarboxylase/2-hydroxyhepta-2,4-diene-1,7-dioate isomerase